jgi:hypothetical protein
VEEAANREEKADRLRSTGEVEDGEDEAEDSAEDEECRLAGGSDLPAGCPGCPLAEDSAEDPVEDLDRPAAVEDPEGEISDG